MKRFKTVISLFLCLCMILPASVAALASAADGKCDCENTPVVYVTGKGGVYADPENDLSETVLDLSEEEIAKMALAILPMFGLSLLTDNWQPYCDALYTQVSGFFADYALSPDGTVTNGSGSGWRWSRENMADHHQSAEIENMELMGYYHYHYDARTDPFLVADGMNEYIEAVREVTGHDKVRIVCRCIGTAFVMTYLYKYELPRAYSGIEGVIFYNGTLGGVPLVGDLYTGKMAFDDSATYRYAADLIDLEDDIVEELLLSTISLMNDSSALGFMTDKLDYVMSRVRNDVMPRLFKSTYATLPGYWTLVGDEYYEDAKSFIFGDDTETYAGVIEKADNYHYNIQKNLKPLLLSMRDDYGIKVGFVAKYGFGSIPVGESTNTAVGEDMSTAASQSMGATCSEIGGVLSDEYIASLADTRYLSPDKQIDASTCLMPDTTWFIKGANHDTFPLCLDKLFWEFFRHEGGLTVFDEEEFPQYLLYTDNDGDANVKNGTMSPLTEENCNIEDWTQNGIDSNDGGARLIATLVRLLTAIITAIVSLFVE